METAIKKYKTVIIGAGPSGSYLAYTLAKFGQDVLLIDKASFPRKKLCGGMLTRKAYSLLPEEIPDKFKSAIVHYIELTEGDVVKCTAKLKDPIITVDREEFDSWLVDLAKNSGANTLFGYRVKSVDNSEKTLLVCKGAEEFNIEFENVVYACGLEGITSKFRTKKYCHGTAEALIKVNPTNTVQLDIGKHRTKSGYIWRIPRKDGIVVGLGSYKSAAQDIEAYVNKFYSDETVENLGIAPIYYGLNKKLCKTVKHTYVIGDSIGACDPLIGEGLFLAFLTARFAALGIMSGNMKEYTGYMLGLYTYLKRSHKVNKFVNLIYPVLPKLVQNRDNFFSFVCNTAVSEYAQDEMGIIRLMRLYIKHKKLSISLTNTHKF